MRNRRVVECCDRRINSHFKISSKQGVPYPLKADLARAAAESGRGIELDLCRVGTIQYFSDRPGQIVVHHRFMS